MISLSKKIVLSAGVVFANFAFAQTVQEGIANVDSHKYAKAKQIFGDMITKAPNDASNYFYLGNSYLSQFDPNFEKAEEYFKKGLALDSKGYLNKNGFSIIVVIVNEVKFCNFKHCITVFISIFDIINKVLRYLRILLKSEVVRRQSFVSRCVR